MIAADTETALIRSGLLAPPLTCGSFAGPDGAVLLGYREAIERFRECLDGEVVGCNLPYDLAVYAQEDPTLFAKIFKALDEGRLLDVALIQKLIDNANGELGGYFPGGGRRKVEYRYSLAALVQRHLKRDRSAEKEDPNSWRLRYGELRGVPVEDYPAEAKRYALADATDTLEVLQAQAPQMGLVRDLPHQMQAKFALHLMSCWGVHTDPVAIQKLEVVADERYQRLTKELIEGGLLRAPKTKRNGTETPSTRDTKAAKARMIACMEALGEPVKLTDKGEEILKERDLTPEETLKYTALDADACAASGDDLLIAYAERTSIATVVTSNIPALKKGILEPIQPEYNELLETGRTSCREESKVLNGYQIQNVRRLPGIRECFVPRPWYVFFDVDYAMLELRTVAQVLLKVVGWSRLAEALNAGLDVHLALASQIVGCSYEEAKVRRKMKEELIVRARQIAKGANFGFPGSMGAKGFQIYARTQPEKIMLTLEECKELRQNWLAAWPEFNDYFAFCKAICEAEGVLQEQLFSGRLRGRVPYGAFCNGFFQGLGADAAKAGLYAVSKACYTEVPCFVCNGRGGQTEINEEGDDVWRNCNRCGAGRSTSTGVSALFGSRPWGFIHDQILGECLEEIGHEAAFECRDVMVKAANVWLPDVPVDAEPVLCRRWSKNAEQVWEGGRLVAWEWRT